MLRADEEHHVSPAPEAETTVHLGNPVAHMAPTNGGAPGPQSPPLESERLTKFFGTLNILLVKF